MNITTCDGPLEEAGHHLAAGLDHHEEARATHAEVCVGLEIIDDLVTRAASACGNDGEVRRRLADIAAEAKLTRAKHGDTDASQRAIRRAIEAAQKCISPAKDNGDAVLPGRGAISATPRRRWKWMRPHV